jgi:hypothetical protein
VSPRRTVIRRPSVEAARQTLALRFGQFDDVQCDALCRGSIRGVALISLGKPDAVASGILDVRDKPGHGLSIADIGWRYV